MPRYKRPSVHERAYCHHRCHGTRSLASSLGKTTKGFGCHKKWDRNRMPRLNTSKPIHNVNSAQKSNVYRSSSNTKTGPLKRKAKRGGRPQSNQKTSTRFQGDSAGARGTSLRPALPVRRGRPKRRVLKGRSLAGNKWKLHRLAIHNGSVSTCSRRVPKHSSKHTLVLFITAHPKF